jgi:regulator of protease activity HflC (stomatin/prohibitin superfamily)
MNETLLEDILMPYTTLTVSAVLAIVILYNTIKILREYERGVIFLLGRFQKVKGPGLILLIPGIQKMVKVDLRVIVMDVPTQDVISRDNVSVKVNAVIYFRIVDPEKAVIRVENAFEATSQLSQTTRRYACRTRQIECRYSGTARPTH